MDFNLFCEILVNSTVCLLILLSFSLADHFELSTYNDDCFIHKLCEVRVKTAKRPINKIVKHNFNRFTNYIKFVEAAIINEAETEISSWLELIGSVLNTIHEFYNLDLGIMAAAHIENSSNIKLPDQQDRGRVLINDYRLHFEEDGQVHGESSTRHYDYTEAYEYSKMSTQTIAFELIGDLHTADFATRDLTRVSLVTKSEAFISDNHLVLMSWNEVTVDKRNCLHRLRLRDTLGRETALVHDKGRRVTTIYRSPRLVFWQPIDDSRETTDYSELLECASSFSMLMLIIIMTLLLEITKNGLEGKSKFSS